jgi:hypothetical protein
VLCSRLLRPVSHLNNRRLAGNPGSSAAGGALDCAPIVGVQGGNSRAYLVLTLRLKHCQKRVSESAGGAFYAGGVFLCAATLAGRVM